MTALDTPRDVAQGMLGALGILADLATPFLRDRRSHWGLDARLTAHAFLGDENVPEPSWSWTHGIEIDAPVEQVWPWVAQMGQEKAGFYSYQWLENLFGCGIRNAEVIQPEWARLALGDGFRLHPKAPPLHVTHLDEGRAFVVSDVPDPSSGPGPDALSRERWVHASWAFVVEPLGEERCRFVSRYRVAYGHDWRMRLLFGPWIMESIGFVMDRRMLLGVKQRAERASGAARSRLPANAPS